MTTHQPGSPMDHEYDGIKEFDNPTPGWWHSIFIVTILFAFVYFIFFQASPLGWTLDEALASRTDKMQKAMFGSLGTLNPDETTILSMMNDPRALSIQTSTWQMHCVSCHGASGEGLVGPNMTDDSYKNAKSLSDLYTVISDGAANGAMPAWSSRLNQTERVLMAAYVAGMRGKNLPGPRAAEGEVIPPWPSPSGS